MSNTVNVIHIKASPEEAAENLLDTLKGELKRKGDILCSAWTELHTLLSQPGVVTVEEPTVLSTLQEKGTLLSTTWNELYNLIAAYQTELSSREGQVVAAWAQIQNKEQVVNDLKQKLAITQEELLRKTELLLSTQATLNAVSSQHKQSDSDIKQAEVAKIQSDMEEKETLLSNLTLEKMALVAKVEELEAELQNIDPIRVERERTLEKYRAEVIRLTEENGSLMDKFKIAKHVSEAVVVSKPSSPNDAADFSTSSSTKGNPIVLNVDGDKKASTLARTITPKKARNSSQARPVVSPKAVTINPASQKTGVRRRKSEPDPDTPLTDVETSKQEVPLRSKRGRLIKAKRQIEATHTPVSRQVQPS